MIFQPLQQHVVEPGGMHDLADAAIGKAVEQHAGVTAEARQESRVIRKARNKVFDMVGELGVTAADMRQVRIDFADFLCFDRPHRVGVDVLPLHDRP
jgi:hypothetical protein